MKPIRRSGADIRAQLLGLLARLCEDRSRMKSDHIMARELGMSPTTIADYLHELVADGLVMVDTMLDERGPRHRRRRVFVDSVGHWSRWSDPAKNPMIDGTAVVERRSLVIDDDTAELVAKAMRGRVFGTPVLSARPLRRLVAPPLMSLTGSSVLQSFTPTRER